MGIKFLATVAMDYPCTFGGEDVRDKINRAEMERIMESSEYLTTEFAACQTAMSAHDMTQVRSWCLEFCFKEGFRVGWLRGMDLGKKFGPDPYAQILMQPREPEERMRMCCYAAMITVSAECRWCMTRRFPFLSQGQIRGFVEEGFSAGYAGGFHATMSARGAPAA